MKTIERMWRRVKVSAEVASIFLFVVFLWAIRFHDDDED